MATMKSSEYEAKILKELKEFSGRDLKGWMKHISAAGLDGHKKIVDHLKKEHSFNHAQATVVAMVYLNDGNPVYGAETDLLGDLFKNKEDKKPLYEAVLAAVQKAVPGCQPEAKKTYVSLANGREFAAVKPMTKELRIAFDLDQPFEGRLQPSKSMGAMPRISHMVCIQTADDIDEEIGMLAAQADKRVNS